MSVKPINIVMSIAQSQNLKPMDSDAGIKHATQAEQINLQNMKQKESVTKIPDDDNHTEIMDTIKQGMEHNGNQDPSSGHYHSEELEIIEKALLDDDSGKNLDIMG